jgi:UDP-3-O-[3-hydroxymyristoyl] glucosamine N-acyltransferase
MGVVHRALLGLASRARNVYYRCLGTRIEGYVWMRRISIPRNWRDISLGAGVALDDGVVLLANGDPQDGKLTIGADTYVNRYTVFDAHRKLAIGRNVMIGPHCYFTDADHGTDPAAPVRSQPMRYRPLIVEDEAWIGAHVTVLPGVTIGRGAVVAAGAVVTRDVAPMTVVAGVPARLLRHRDGRAGGG